MNISLSWLKKVNGFTAQWVITVFVVGLMIGVLVGGAGVLTPPHRAAWVQAIGTIIAVAFAGFIAVWQVKRNHELAVERQECERKANLKSLAHSLYLTASDCLDWMQRYRKDVDTLESLMENHGTKGGIGALDVTVENINAIRFHKLPPELVEPMIPICNIFPIFVNVIADMFKNYRQIDAAKLEERHKTLDSMLKHAKQAVEKLKKIAEIEEAP